MIIEIFSSLVLLVAFAAFAARRLLLYLHAFQQEEYDQSRFLNWLWVHKVFDRKLSAILFICGILWFFKLPAFVLDFIIFTGFAVMAYIERDPLKESKKKLVMTDRAKRIFTGALIFAVLTAPPALLAGMPWIWLVGVQALPFLIVLSNIILTPYEDKLQNTYWQEAHTKIKELKPVVIGITGSYGKTSVKHILGHILSAQASTLITPGSVNTPMGIARIIREQLDETHKFLIVEMGAYGPGSIARLCSLTPPDHGVITTIGHAHYERFKSLDTVAKAKFELAEAVIKKNGKLISHENAFKFRDSLNLKEQHPESFILCGDTANDNLKIKSINQTTQGLEVKINWDKTDYTLEPPLYGTHHGVNAAMAFAMACLLGLEPEDVIATIKKIPQITHRLEVKKSSKGAMIIDDAFNSNPPGFYAALDLLDFIGMKKRKILITPGIVELGRTHDEVHRQIGEYAAKKCDTCILIQPERIKTFIEGFDKGNSHSAELIEMETFDEAQKWLAGNLSENDVVLLENDLPDVYERIPKL